MNTKCTWIRHSILFNQIVVFHVPCIMSFRFNCNLSQFYSLSPFFPVCSYGHYAEGTGSVLKMATIDDSDIFRRYQDLSDDKQKADLLSILKLRYFTPREVANLHGFPNDFCLPSSLSLKQQYRLLGNSLNVLVVSELLNCLFHAP